jgi:RNA polymerase sigma factor (sigma-70 family)
MSQNFENIYQLHYSKVYRLCKGYFGGDSDTAADATQEVFIKVWENLPKFRAESQISTWIYRIAVNTCLTYLRKQNSKKELLIIPNENEINEEIDEKISKMYGCISKLEPTDKLVISMVLENIPYEKIAEIIGITEETLRVKIHRIKIKLTKCVQNERL